MRGSQDAHRHPTAPLDFYFEAHIPHDAISHDIGAGHRIAIHDQFDRDFASVTNPGAFHMPVWLLVDLPMFGSSGFFVQQGCDFCGCMYGLRPWQRQLAFILTDCGLVHFEFE